MEISFTFVDMFNPVAIYAAMVATAVLIWDVVKWYKSGPAFRGSVSPNMVMIGMPGYPKDQEYVVFRLSNTGSRATTLTHVGLQEYPNWLARLRRKSTRSAVINADFDPYRIPYVLEPGHDYMGMALQSDELIEWSQCGNLYGVVYHSGSDRPLAFRIPPIKTKD